MLEHLAHGAELFRPAVIRGRSRPPGRENAGLRQVVRVHKLVTVVPAPEHRDVITLANPLEEDLENAEPSVPHDGARANDGDVQAGGRSPGAQFLALQLGAPVSFTGRRRRGLGDGVGRRHAEDGAGGHVNDLAHPGRGSGLEQSPGALDID